MVVLCSELILFNLCKVENMDFLNDRLYIFRYDYVYDNLKIYVYVIG